MAKMVPGDNQEQLDPRLIALLDQLRPTPPRDPEAVKHGRERFLAELEYLSLPTPSRSLWERLARRLGYRRDQHNTEEGINMSTPRRRFAFTSIAVIIIVLAFLFGGSAMTALASQSALPGDALYPVKTSLEQTRLSLARDAADRGQLQMEFAERRLREIEALIAEGRYQNISTATAEFEAHIQNALAELETISQGDPARAADLMLQITESLTRYAQSLGNMLSKVPEPVQAEMQRAIQTIYGVSGRDISAGEIEFTGIVESIGPETWLIAGRPVRVTSQTEIKGVIEVGKTVKVHAVQGAGGELTAREIELPVAGPDNANTNANGNENANVNANANGNENTNANVNANGNENLNGNQNTNANVNTNSNANANEDRQGNENRNTNTNVNANDNEASNENRNANDDRGNGNGDDGEGSNRNDNINTNTNTNTNLNANSNDNQNRNDNQNTNDGDDDDDDDDGYSGGDT